MMRDNVIDAREMEPPEPMEKALEAVAVLKPGERVRMLIHREPRMLFPILQRDGFAFETHATDEGHFEVLIWRRN